MPPPRYASKGAISFLARYVRRRFFSLLQPVVWPTAPEVGTDALSTSSSKCKDAVTLPVLAAASFMLAALTACGSIVQPGPSPASVPTQAPPDSPPLPAAPSRSRASSTQHFAHKRKKQERPWEELPQTAAVVQGPGAMVNAQIARIRSPLTPVLGKNVRDPNGQDLGRVVDILAEYKDSNGLRVLIRSVAAADAAGVSNSEK